eukprot:5365546-Pleurochrysis_carterae.AAC.1
MLLVRVLALAANVVDEAQSRTGVALGEMHSHATLDDVACSTGNVGPRTWRCTRRTGWCRSAKAADE